MMKPIILASASPRRQELLQQVKIPFEVKISPAKESSWQGEPAASYALSQATLKTEAVFSLFPNAPAVLGADTVVVVDSQVLGKAKHIEEAKEMLSTLQGRSHKVMTAFCIRKTTRKPVDRIVETKVKFRSLSTEEIQGYLRTNEWKGKAGSYAIQGIAGAFVETITGSYPNVVGLPIAEVISSLLSLQVFSHFPVISEV